MPFHDDKHLMIEGLITWDSLTRPETNTGGDIKHSLRVAVPPTSPDLANLELIANNELTEGKWRGNLPAGGRMPVSDASGETAKLLPGHKVISASTTQGAPQVFDINGAVLDAMTYGPMIYSGSKVKLLIHAFTYDNINKGVAFGLDGVQVVDATLPKLAISGGIDASKAFGAGAATPPPAAPPAAPHPGILGGKMMLPAATNTYEEYIAAGWTDEQLIQNGFMQA